MDSGSVIRSLALLLIVFDLVNTSPKIDHELKDEKLNDVKRNGSAKNLRQGLPESVELDSDRDVYQEMESNQDDDVESDDFPQDRDDDNDDDNQDDGNNDDVVVDDDDDDGENHGDNEHYGDGEDYTSMEPINTVDQGEAGSKTRSLVAGDTFTPSEMLIISKRLMARVENPGRGKGIISSAQNPYQLTDKLFEAFFVSCKRIVTIEETDISGLDALQALSISGDVVNNLRASDTETLANINKEHYRNPRKCHYKLLRKPIDEWRIAVKRRQAETLNKRLGKNRKLIINPGRRGTLLGKKNKKKPRKDHNIKHVHTSEKGKGKKGLLTSGNKAALLNDKNQIMKPGRLGLGLGGLLAKKNKKKPRKDHNREDKHFSKKRQGKKGLRTTGNKTSRLKIKQLQSKEGPNKSANKFVNHTLVTEEQQSVCRWKYGCLQPAYLKTCSVKAVCEKRSTEPFTPIKVPDNENKRVIRRFRKMIGIDKIDEEVEKILEVHRITSHPLNEDGVRIESLAEFFNKIMITDTGATKSIKLNNEQTTEYQALMGSDSETSLNKNDERLTDNEDDQARRILGLIPLPPQTQNITGPPPRYHLGDE